MSRQQRRAAGRGWTRLFRPNRPPPRPGELLEVSPGLRLHLESFGSGPATVLLVHGYLGSTGIWYAVANRIARAVRCRVLAVDLPGAGHSDKPLDAPYTLPWLARQLQRLLELLDMPQPLVVGHSLGGAACLYLAAERQQLLRALLLVSPLVFRPPPPPGLKLAKRWPGPARVFFQSAGRLLIPHLVRKALYANGHFDTKPSARLMLGFLDAPGGWEAATRMGLRAHDYSPDVELLSRVRVPTRVVWGGRDSSHDPELARRLQLALGGTRELVVLPHAGHNCHEEEPEVFTSLVADWYRKWQCGGSSKMEQSRIPPAGPAANHP